MACVSVVVVGPDYNMTKLFVSPPVEENATADDLMRRNFVVIGHNVTLSRAHEGGHCVNSMFTIPNITAVISNGQYLPGTVR